MFQKLIKLLRSRFVLIALLIMNVFIFIVGLALNSMDLLFISGCSYATVLLSMYLNKDEEHK
tara:strand:- start:435 stop:620 length:186 start_codon:yes stop_codon:yes gene_type:complete